MGIRGGHDNRALILLAGILLSLAAGTWGVFLLLGQLPSNRITLREDGHASDAARREAAEKIETVGVVPVRRAPLPSARRPLMSSDGDTPVETARLGIRKDASSALDLLQTASIPQFAPAAQTLSTIKVGRLPLEQQRIDEERSLSEPDIRLVMGFECSEELAVEKVSPTHFVIDVNTRRVLRNWFLFKIEGAAGRTVRIDFKNAQLWKWSTLNPVYSYVTDLDDPASFASELVADPRPVMAANGPILPDTSGQKWHFVSQVWMPPSRPRVGTLSMVQTFERDSAYVAMKYPYTPGYNAAFLASLENNPYAQVFTVGYSEEGRPLQIVKIGGDEEADRERPCVLMYGREHATEHDTSWVVEGAARYLLSDDPEAVTLRERVTFLLIPILDPDGAAAGVYDHLNGSFRRRNAAPEALAYAAWFEQWVDDGKRLDVALNLHNMESAEMGHMHCSYIDPGRPEPCKALHRALLRQFAGTFYKVRAQAGEGYTTTQLNGFLGYFYGPLPLLYEFNSQEGERHLTIGEMREMGRRMVVGCMEYFGSADADAALLTIEHLRAGRQQRLRYVSGDLNPIERAYSSNWTTIHAAQMLQAANDWNVAAKE